MTTFLIRRLCISVILLFFISIVSFFIVTLTPGSPYPWGELNPKISPEVKANFRKQFYLDRPLHEQYWLNLQALFTGELRSIKDGRPVIDRIKERLPATLRLNLLSLAIALSFGLLLGISSARSAGSLKDLLFSLLAFALLALPSFWISYLVIIALTKWVGIPILGTASYGVTIPNAWAAFLDKVWHIALPATLLALGGIAAQSRYIRATLIESFHEDYIRTARAKGLDEQTVTYHHALRNSIRPLITGIGALLPALIGGSVIIESIFAYPGIGRMGYQAVLERDYPMLIALNFITACLILGGNLLADILYAVVDPRVRLE